MLEYPDEKILHSPAEHIRGALEFVDEVMGTADLQDTRSRRLRMGLGAAVALETTDATEWFNVGGRLFKRMEISMRELHDEEVKERKEFARKLRR